MANNASNIKGLGGNAMGIAELTGAYAILTSYTLNTNGCLLGHLKDSDVKTNLSKTEYKSEDGINRATEKTRTLEVDASLMERDKAKVDYLSFTAKPGSLLYRNQGVVNGKTQELWAICDPDLQYNLKTPGGADSGKFTASLVAPAAAVTFSATDLTALAALWGITIKATTVTIAINQEYNITETT